jgi:transposase-like protein
LTWQETVLPKDTGQLYLQYLLLGENYARTAEHYGCHESSVRKRIRKYTMEKGIVNDDGKRTPRQ